MQAAIGVGFVLLVGALLAAFLTIAFDSRTEPAEATYVRASRIRRWWLGILVVFAAVAFVVSMAGLPYVAVREVTDPGPSDVVTVTARQFAFELQSRCLPSDRPTEFRVTSSDVNHGFAVYDEAGRIVGQVQAMPGYVNVLRLRFDTAGTYRLHCTELCGPGHASMSGSFDVGTCDASGGCGGC
jgi:cytochrome c oxidase subunit 2